MSEWEAVGMVLMALTTIGGAFAVVAKPLMRLDRTLVTLETAVDRLREMIEDQRTTVKDHEARIDRLEGTQTEHGLRIVRLEEECERRHG